MVGNYIHHTSGRSPKVGGTTLLHAVNNMFHDNTGHAFDIGSSGSRVVVEGNVFQNVKTPLLANSGRLFSVPSNGAACQQYLKHTCQVNAFGSSGSFVGTDTSFLSNFNGYSVAGATTANSNVRNTAGVGKI
jgi:pectin lyase